MADKLTPAQVELIQSLTWRKRHRFSFQSLALIAALLASLALYWALEAGHNVMAAFFFGLLALAMAVTIWIG
jgi:hypothetical protein